MAENYQQSTGEVYYARPAITQYVENLMPPIEESEMRERVSSMLLGVPPVPTLDATAKMLELLDLQPTDILLEIGTGTGSQTAVWQNYCKEVHSVELNEQYHILENQPLGPHVYLSYGDGAEGLPDVAPFDAIVVTCGTKEIPPAWCDQLRDGGRLVVPVGLPEGQKLTLFRKMGAHLIPVKVAAYCRFIMMEKP